VKESLKKGDMVRSCDPGNQDSSREKVVWKRDVSNLFFVMDTKV
jgi:hypothetical protein